jgi:ankyrin repeat protein
MTENWEGSTSPPESETRADTGCTLSDPVAIELLQKLHQAVDDGQEDDVRRLIQKGADVNASWDYRIALSIALSHGNESMVKLLLDSGCNAVCRYHSPDSLILVEAVKIGNVAILKLLLDHGADVEVNYEDVYGECTALYCTTYWRWDASTQPEMTDDERSEAIAKLLLQCGADFRILSYPGISPPFKAAVFGRNSMLKLFLERGFNTEETIEGCYPKPISSHPKPDYGELFTVLHYACQRRHYSTVDLLLEADADVNARSRTLRTPLHCVAYSLSKEDSIGLDQGGTKKNLDEKDGRNSLAIARTLIEHGADIKATTNTNLTPLHAAVRVGDEVASTVRFLIEKGADVNAKDNKRRTPLHATVLGNALRPGQLEAARILMENGADINAQMDGGFTALDIAVGKELLDMASLLREMGAMTSLRQFPKTKAVRPWPGMGRGRGK